MTVAVLQARKYLRSAIWEIQPDIVEYLLSIGVDATWTGQRVGNKEQQRHTVNMQLYFPHACFFVLTPLAITNTAAAGAGAKPAP